MERNGFLPEKIKIVDPKEIAHKIFSLIFNHLQHEGISEHARGASAQLDRVMYDSDGNYHNRMALDERIYDSYLREG